MARWNFRTVPEELLEDSATLADNFVLRGYTVSPEKSELGFPFTPTLWVKRKHTVAVVELVGRIDEKRVREWVAYGKSTGMDFRLYIAVNDGLGLSEAHEKMLREAGVGCLVVSSGGISERLPASDLALGLALPGLKSLPLRARRLLAPAYEQFDRGQWREGFEEACQAFEAEARRYLKRHCSSGRVQLQSKNGLIVPKASAIDRATMGGLKDMFNRIISQNRADSLIADTLEQVNKDRIGVVHHKGKRRVENRLRKNVGRHMWSLVNAIKEVVK